jgi:hypothetical protein
VKDLKVDCHEVFTIRVAEADFQRWNTIQNAMPYLGASDRELLISGTCGTCFDEMFK